MQTRVWKCSSQSHGCSSSVQAVDGGQVLKKALLTRVDLFNSGMKRALRAFHMVEVGEVSAGRQALEGASLATGVEWTLRALKDPRGALVRPFQERLSRWIKSCSRLTFEQRGREPPQDHPA